MYSLLYSHRKFYKTMLAEQALQSLKLRNFTCLLNAMIIAMLIIIKRTIFSRTCLVYLYSCCVF